MRLLAQPLLQGTEGGRRPTALYTSLLRSDSVLEKTTERLRLDGTLTNTESLSFSDHLGIEARGEDTETFVINLTAKSDSAEKAASIANAWAEVFIEESREMLTSTASSSGVLLEQELVPTRRADGRAGDPPGRPCSTSTGSWRRRPRPAGTRGSRRPAIGPN